MNRSLAATLALALVLMFGAIPAAFAQAAARRSPVAPRTEQVKAAVNEAYAKFKGDTSGKNADYIP